MFQDFSLPDGVLGCLLGGGRAPSGAEEYLTIDQVAQWLKLSPKSVRNKMASGVFRRGVHYFSPPGLGPRFKWSALVAWLERERLPLQPLTAAAAESPEGSGIPMARGYMLGSGSGA